jgi:NTP pyrophosphatase (non-canonical NTP hydrolase)
MVLSYYEEAEPKDPSGKGELALRKTLSSEESMELAEAFRSLEYFSIKGLAKQASSKAGDVLGDVHQKAKSVFKDIFK